jgi:hypothetical protein
VAQRALDAHRLHAARVGDRRDADDCVELEQRDGRRRIVEVDLAGLQLFLQRVGQRVRVDLQADGQRRLRRDARADAAVLLAGDRLVQAQRVAPERLAAEGVEAKCLSPSSSICCE